MKTKKRNVVTLREDLDKLHQRICAGKENIETMTVANNTAGKILQSAKLQLDYFKFRKEKRTIKFLEQ